MDTINRRTRTAPVFASVLAVWAFLTLVSGAMAQVPAETQPNAVDHYRDQSLRVSLWLNKDADQIFKRGEQLQVTFQTNEDAYAVLYRIDVEGRVDILWPTSRYSDGFVFGGHQYRLPSTEGPKLRIGDGEGMGYVQAVVSRYPFDLRDLEVDFHHENDQGEFGFYVAGDPFLAMNEVNYAVTGLEDASEMVVTNYVNYYVHRKVDHPRFLCYQCHDDADGYQPYSDTCTVEIHYDHGWQNDWWVSYGFYPAYYYPTYYYIDPWTRARWVNYWYDPWYSWPSVYSHRWDYQCYDWHHSPHWRQDSYTAYKHGNRRYRPLDKDSLIRSRTVLTTRSKNVLVTGKSPGDERIRRMKDREVTSRTDDRTRDGSTTALDRTRIPAGGTALRNVSPVTRSQTRFEQNNRIRTSPGLRVPGSGETDGGVSRTSQSRLRTGTVRSGSSGTTTRTESRRSADSRETIKPVESRRDQGRVWTNRRSSSSANTRQSTSPTRTVKPVSRNSRSSGSSSGESSGGTSVQRPTKTPQQIKQTTPARSGSTTSSKSGESGKSSGTSSSRGTKSSGGRR